MRNANAKAPNTKEQWQALANSSVQPVATGANNRVPPAVAAGATPGRPWSLTEEFNKAAKKPHGPAFSPNAKKEIAELRKQMQAAAAGVKAANQNRPRHQQIASKQGITDLRKKMSQPRNTWELTPLGSVTRSYDPKRDRTISLQIKRMETALSNRKGQAQAAFNRFASRGR